MKYRLSQIAAVVGGRFSGTDCEVQSVVTDSRSLTCELGSGPVFVAMCGAKPLYIAACFVLEEGFEIAKLEKIIESMARTAHEAGVQIVTGDTKVVEKGHGDGL